MLRVKSINDLKSRKNRLVEYLISRLEASRCNFFDCALFMVGLFSRNNRSVGDKGKVNSGIGHQIVLKLTQIDIQSALKSQRLCYWRHGLSDDAIQVGVSRSIYGHVLQTDFVDCLKTREINYIKKIVFLAWLFWPTNHYREQSLLLKTLIFHILLFIL